MKFFMSLFLLSAMAYASEPYKVHEWGTFTSLVGSNGQRQDGMFYEDEVLPDFVHNFGEQVSLVTPEPVPVPRPRPCHPHSKVGCEFLQDQVITQKMETPVLYFHSKMAQKVVVDVGFPEGIISQTYPAPSFSLPLAIPGVSLTNGFARFNIELQTNDLLELPKVDASNIYSHARKVDANTVVSNGEVEKFIFYRGLGKFESKLLITSLNGSMTLKNTSAKNIPSVFLVDSNVDGGGAILPLGNVSAGKKLFVSDKSLLALKANRQSFPGFSKLAKKLLLDSLVANGLYQDEAVAMVNTWEHGYFKTNGLRVLYVLNRNEVESILPMKITPAPGELNRVFVGRIEVLLDTVENDIYKQVLSEREHFDVLTLGRFAASIIGRIEQLANERGVMDSKLLKIFDQYNQTIAVNL